MIANKLKINIAEDLMQKPMEVTELAEQLNVERSRVSHALLTLKKCHIVEARKNGKSRVYSLNKKTVKPLMALVDKHVSNYCSHKHCWAKNNKV